MRACRRLVLALPVLALVACASNPGDEPRRARALASYAADPFVPANLYVNADEHLPPALAAQVEQLARQLRSSGAFVRLDRGVQRWPITLQMRYEVERAAASGDGARRLLGALALGLIPIRVSDRHRLFAEVLAEPESLAALELEVTVGRRVSVYGGRQAQAADRAAIESLLEGLLAEIAQRRLVPRWKRFEPAPKAPRKIPGRPT